MQGLQCDLHAPPSVPCRAFDPANSPDSDNQAQALHPAYSLQRPGKITASVQSDDGYDYRSDHFGPLECNKVGTPQQFSPLFHLAVMRSEAERRRYRRGRAPRISMDISSRDPPMRRYRTIA